MEVDRKISNLTLSPRNNPNYLLSCCRVHDPGQDQPGHPDEEGPENFLHLLILPERLDRGSRICLHRPLDQLRQEHKQRQEQERSADECQARVSPARYVESDRGRKGSGQHRSHLHLPEPEVMPLLGIVQPLSIGQHGEIEDTERVQHPIPDCVHLIRVCNDAEEEDDERYDSYKRCRDFPFHINNVRPFIKLLNQVNRNLHPESPCEIRVVILYADILLFKQVKERSCMVLE